MLDAKSHARYVREFAAAYRAHEGDPVAREAACLECRAAYVMEDLTRPDFYAGRYRNLAVGFAPQEANCFGYFLNEPVCNELLEALDMEEAAALEPVLAYWRTQTCDRRLRESYPPEMAEVLPSDRFLDDDEVGFPLYRVGGLHLDFGKLVRLGLPGLRRLLQEKKAAAAQEKKQFYAAMEAALQSLDSILESYRRQAVDLGLEEVAAAVGALREREPRSMREALQLVHLYAVFSGCFNYGRMDTYLGRFAGEENALSCLVEFWKCIEDRGITWDGRIIVGGMGRENEEAADRFALLAIEASRVYRDTLPQLSLRFYEGQNPILLQRAYDNFAEGVVYPILYCDEVNVPAVEQAFEVDRETAEQYVPFGCGEYILDHRSVGTPSGVINLLKALERTLDQGREYESFEELFADYAATSERTVRQLALQEKLEYDFAGETAPFLLYSLLTDDCVERGKPLLSGGIRYLGGTLETYGNINTADSLIAIKRLVFDEKKLTISRLREALKADFRGFETERRWMLSCPKYGNDDGEADSMAVRVHEHICNFVRAQAKEAGLHSYLAVIINNNANSGMGYRTGASADGRGAREPMANANNPMGGRDQNGVTAFLNSLVKLNPALHAGAVQNMKFSRSLLTEHREKFEQLMKAYFQRGQQAMLNILNRGDLEDALERPENYPNLIVRVGGFSARFVELDRLTQRDIVSRTLY